MGYYKDKGEAITPDGWLRTGDVGKDLLNDMVRFLWSFFDYNSYMPTSHPNQKSTSFHIKSPYYSNHSYNFC